MEEINNKENGQWQLLVLILKEIASEKKITHDEISEKTGYLRSNITRFFSLKYTPRIDTFLEIAKAIGVNFFFEDKDGTTDLNLIFEKAMTELGRRPKNLLQN